MSKMRISTNSKIIIAVIAAVLGALLLVGVVGNAFGLFAKPLDEMFDKERNEANYLKNWTLKSQNAGDGITVTVNEDGSVKLNGKNSGGSDIKYTYETVSLAAGEYSLWGNGSGAQLSTYYIVATDANGTELAKADFDGSNTFTLTESTNVTVSIVVVGGESVNATFTPLLVSGTENVGFYAD